MSDPQSLPRQNGVVEHAVKAHEVRPGDYLPGLGRVQSYTDSGGPRYNRRITIHSEGNDWRVSLNPYHDVVVIRNA